MRAIRAIFFVVLFVAAVFVASANRAAVEVVYMPQIQGLAGFEQTRAVQTPLFLLILASLLIGVLTGGLGAIVEQASLRLGLRRAGKLRDRALKEKAEAEALLETAQDSANDARAELAEAKLEMAKLKAELDAQGGGADDSGADMEELSPFVEPEEGEAEGGALVSDPETPGADEGATPEDDRR